MGDVTVGDVTVGDVTVGDVTVGDVTVDDVTLGDVTVDDVTVGDVTVGDVRMTTSRLAMVVGDGGDHAAPSGRNSGTAVMRCSSSNGSPSTISATRMPAGTMSITARSVKTRVTQATPVSG